MHNVFGIVLGASFLMAAAIAVSGPGAQFGLWDYGTGLAIIRKLSIPVLIGAAGSGIILIFSLFAARGFLGFALLTTLAAGLAGYVPLEMKRQVASNPIIHDITTDFKDPPKIVAAASLPRKNPVDYLGSTMAPRSNVTVMEAQKEAFPDIAPAFVNSSVDETAEIVAGLVSSMGMVIIDDGPIDRGWRIEAAQTSRWFGFVDDFIVRIRPEAGRTRVDVRSKSRVGGSDLGVNAARTRDFFERLNAVSAL